VCGHTIEPAANRAPPFVTAILLPQLSVSCPPSQNTADYDPTRWASTTALFAAEIADYVVARSNTASHRCAPNRRSASAKPAVLW
jgi:hypothetical protein